jgi:hypothetical protein
MSGLVFTRLHLPLPLDAQAVVRLLARLTQPDTPRPLVFETRIDDSGIRYLIGTDPQDASRLVRLLEQHLPGMRTDKTTERGQALAVGRLRIRPGVLPLDVAAADRTLYNLHGAFASRRDGEVLVLQLCLGRGHRPATVPARAAAPQASLLDALLGGTRPATADVRARLRLRAEQPTVAATVRLAVQAETPERRRALMLELLGALRTLEAPGVRIDLVREANAALDSGRLAGSVALAPIELAPLLGWPLGDDPLPGMPRLHPKRVAAPVGLSQEESVFAITAVPGDERPIGMRTECRLQHTVVLGPTGSGKSMVFARLILDDIAAGRPSVLVDPKRQLVDHVLDRIPAGKEDNVVVLDAADKNPVGFNPLDTEGRNADVVVDGILSSFKAVFADGWGPRTEDLLHAGLLTLARSGEAKSEPHTLLDLPRLLTDAGFRRSVVGAVSRDKTLASFWAGYEELSSGARANIIAAPMNKLRKYVLRRNLADVLGQPRPRFRLRDVFREGKTVLVPLNDALLGPGAAQLLGSLVVAELWMATLERAAEDAPAKRPAAIYIDEVQQFLNLPTSIADALATSRSYGVSWNLAHQFRAQLSPGMRAAFDANARNKIVFALGADDSRDLVRMAPGLEREDFMSLPPYEIYAQVVDHGAPTTWFSARTLPPSESLGTRAVVLRSSRKHYGSHGEPDTTTRATPEPNLPTTGHRKARRP